MVTALERAEAPAAHLLGWDGIEFWVGNARAFAGFLASSFGFHCTAYSGPETGVRDHVSYVLTQGAVILVVTGATQPESPIAAHVREHGDGVRDLRWLVDDVDAAFRLAVDRGATPLVDPTRVVEGSMTIESAAIAVYGDVRHVFVARRGDPGDRYAPGFTSDRLPPAPAGNTVGLTAVDHVVGNVEEGRLAAWVRFYEEVLGFSTLVTYDESQISTEFSALRSTVVWDGRSIVLPINEPAEGRKRSQIAEYLDAYRGCGVQHIALATDDIVRTVGELRQRGVRFMEVPATYYDEARARVGDRGLEWADLARLEILVDSSDEGILLQIFTEPLCDRPTVFFEIIERRGCRGFGEGNFKALFEAIEREQERRGNL